MTNEGWGSRVDFLDSRLILNVHLPVNVLRRVCVCTADSSVTLSKAESPGHIQMWSLSFSPAASGALLWPPHSAWIVVD